LDFPISINTVSHISESGGILNSSGVLKTISPPISGYFLCEFALVEVADIVDILFPFSTTIPFFVKQEIDLLLQNPIKF
jgi:hypothetical protein